MTRMIRLIVVVVLALGMAGIGGAHLAHPALAATPLSLAGEKFIQTGNGSLSGTCSTDGNGSLTFSVSGIATGPYPGTFTESGSFTITNSRATAFSSTFTLKSGTNTVTGSKSFIGGPHIMICDPGMIVFFVAADTYTASINCAYRDTGTAQVSLAQAPLGGLNGFVEQFLTSNGVVPDENNQGNDNCQGNQNT